MKKNKCIDCKVKISYNAKRCLKCRDKQQSKRMSNRKGKQSNRYIDGRTKAKHYCIDCGKKIAYTTWFCGTKKCHKCGSNKMPRSETFKKKIRETPVKHHIYGKKYKEIWKISRAKHAKLHHSAYFYILERFGKKVIDDYVKWFKKLKDKDDGGLK